MGNHSLKVASLLIWLFRTSLRAQMKLSLHDICGLPAFLVAGTQAPNIFFGRDSPFVLYTLPMHRFVAWVVTPCCKNLPTPYLSNTSILSSIMPDLLSFTLNLQSVYEFALKIRSSCLSLIFLNKCRASASSLQLPYLYQSPHPQSHFDSWLGLCSHR